MSTGFHEKRGKQMGKYNNGKNPKNNEPFRHYKNRNIINKYNTPDFIPNTVCPRIIKKWMWVLVVLIAVVVMTAIYIL